MEAQLYNHYPLGDGCSIVIGLTYENIKELKKAKDTLSINMYGSKSPWGGLVRLLDNIISESEKDDTQGLRYLDAQFKKGME
jgi:hypothetical protein